MNHHIKISDLLTCLQEGENQEDDVLEMRISLDFKRICWRNYLMISTKISLMLILSFADISRNFAPYTDASWLPSDFDTSRHESKSDLFPISDWDTVEYRKYQV